MNHLEDTLDARWATRTLMVEYIMKQDDNKILFDSMLLQVVQNGENNITSPYVALVAHVHFFGVTNMTFVHGGNNISG